MSTPFTRQRSIDVDGSRARRVVASYKTYRDAEQAVDHLADNGFPVERVAIVGRGVQLVEQVTGRMGWLESALRGGLAGAVAGVLIGWLFGVFDWFHPIVASAWLALDGLWFGLLVGAAIGLLQHALAQGHRDFASIRGFHADAFEVLVDDEVADEAEALLRRAGY
jgi:hypothetical protein